MRSIPFDELATIVFVLVDDWYQEQGIRLLKGKRGKKAHFDRIRKSLTCNQWRKTIIGLSTHVIAKMTSHLLKLILRKQFGVDVQTFSAQDQPA